MATTTPRNRVAIENDGNRVDARAKVTGAAKYSYDVNLPNMVYGTFIRSPFAEAKLVSKNLEAARGIPGVLAVEFTGETAEYAGQDVGYVCAETPQLIQDAIAALQMKWEHGTPTTNFRRAAGRLPELQAEEQAKLDATLAKAAHTAEMYLETQVQHHVSLEVHGCVADYKGDHAVVYASTQGTTSFRDGITGDLGLDKSAVEVRCEFIGGGFGSKFGPGIEGKLACTLSKRFNRPCKVFLDRKEESIDSGMRPGSRQYYLLAMDEKGKILGGRNHVWGQVGVRPRGGNVRVVGYDLGDLIRSHVDVSTSQCPPRPQRAPGWPQGMFALDSIFDEAAKACGLDPIQFRMINDPNPVRREQYELAAREIGWDRRKADGAETGVIRRGLGIGAAEWHNQGFAPASVEIRVYPDGRVDVFSATQDIGTATKTLFVDLVANHMKVPRELVTAKLGSSSYPGGPASGGSVVARSVAPRALHAADLATEGILTLVAKETGQSAESLAVRDGAVVKKADGAKVMGWAEACKLIGSDHLSVTGTDVEKYRGEGNSEGVCAAEVEVDTETGVVKVKKLVVIQACGLPVSRKASESQIVGGAIQGLGFALLEEKILNEANGASVNPNMEWYKLPGPADMPEIIPILHHPEGYTGVRSLGEPPIIGVPGAIANAVANAIGARVTSLPITPAKVLAALQV